MKNLAPSKTEDEFARALARALRISIPDRDRSRDPSCYKRYWAYLMATVRHETAATFLPIMERGGQDYFVRRYWDNKKVAKALGNLSQQDAIMYAGRGYVQITGRDNYTRIGKRLGVDLVASPEAAQGPTVALAILVQGSLHGWFTGLGLLRIDTQQNQPLAVRSYRKVINGMDKEELIYGYYCDYLAQFKDDL
jgi:putative chitinase